jgi:hypothetical protein
LQNFLLALPEITIFDNPLKAKLFYEDADKGHLRPGTVLNRNMTYETITRHNEQFFRNQTGNKRLVMVEGIPKWATLGTMTFTLQEILQEEKFEWAYEWNNQPGYGKHPEKNAFPISAG